MTDDQLSHDDARAAAERIARAESGDPETMLAAVRPFRISSLTEMILTRKAVVQATGLAVGDFTENPWGFPYIPHPAPTVGARGDERLVPAAIRFTHSGHPMFWIDARLTEMTETERRDPVRWAVRMFYLMLGFGLIDRDSLQWYNAPATRGVVYSEADLRNYLGDLPSALDDVRFAEADLRMPLARVNAAAAEALTRIDEIRNRESERYATLQRTALADGRRMLEDDTAWRAIDAELNRVALAVAAAARAGQPVSAHIDAAFAAKDRAVDHLTHLDALALILSVPVLATQAYTSSLLARVISLTSQYTTSTLKRAYALQLEEVLSRMFQSGGFRDDSERGTLLGGRAASERAAALERLRLSVENFTRRAAGEVPFTSASEREVFSQFAE